MSALINIPDFLIDGIDINKFSRMQKIYMIFYGKLISLIMKISNRKLMIRMLNILYIRSGKITYEKPFFIKEYNLKQSHKQQSTNNHPRNTNMCFLDNLKQTQRQHNLFSDGPQNPVFWRLARTRFGQGLRFHQKCSNVMQIQEKWTL